MGHTPLTSEESRDVELDVEAREIALRARALEGIELTSLLLWEVTLARGPALDVSPGGISESSSYQMQHNDDSLLFHIGSVFELTNSAGDKIADLDITHLVGFDVQSGREFSDDEAEVILSQARLAAYPFTREKVLAFSADMGLQPIVMPLMRRSTMSPAQHKP